MLQSQIMNNWRNGQYMYIYLVLNVVKPRIACGMTIVSNGSFDEGMHAVWYVVGIAKIQKIISILLPRQMSRWVYGRHFPIWPSRKYKTYKTGHLNIYIYTWMWQLLFNGKKSTIWYTAHWIAPLNINLIRQPFKFYWHVFCGHSHVLWTSLEENCCLLCYTKL